MFVNVRGEALVLPLGEQHLFALLQVGTLSSSFLEGKYASRGRFSGYAINALDFFWTYGRLKYFRWRTVEVPRKFYPRLVTFEDISDPMSVQLVNPDDLGASFGEGYAIDKITISATHKHVTNGVVEAVLGSNYFQLRAGIHKEALNRGARDPYFDTLAGQLNRSHFLKQ